MPFWDHAFQVQLLFVYVCLGKKESIIECTCLWFCMDVCSQPMTIVLTCATALVCCVSDCVHTCESEGGYACALCVPIPVIVNVCMGVYVYVHELQRYAAVCMTW